MLKEFKIYCLKDPNNLEIKYIGATLQKLSTRFAQHKYDAKNRKGTYTSKWFNSILEKKLLPIIEIIEICNENNWEEKEKYWIKYYREKVKKLTNYDIGGKSIILNRSYDSKQRSANAHKIKIVQLDKNGNFIKIHNSAKDAQHELKFKSPTSITNCLNYYYGANTAGGFYWIYYKDYLNNNYTLRKNLPKVNYNKIKKVYLFDENKNLISEFLSLNQLVKFISPNTKSYSGALKQLKLKRKFKGYYLSYKNTI